MRRSRVLLWSCVPTVLISAALFVILSQPLQAQQVTAAITGRVSDPSDAAIPGAKVTAKDTARGTVWTTETNYEGVYNLPRVPVGTYEIRVEAPGFQTAVRPPIELVLNQTARVDVQMKLGQVTQTVEVTGAPPLLSTDTMQLGTVIGSQTNEALPLATRYYVELTLLAPGTVHPNPSEMTAGTGSGFGAGRPYVNGNREQANNFLLDGLDNNQVSDNLIGYTPSPDAIQEFNMITNNAPADFGSFQGGIVSVTIKSGTNALHGNAFEFIRNDKLNAVDWGTNWSNAPDPKTGKAPRPKMRWNTFGGTAGGPIKKDKLFYFGDYSGSRFDNPASVGTLNVFTPTERQGDFGFLCDSGFDANGLCKSQPQSVAFDPKATGRQLYDPSCGGAGCSGGRRSFFPFNKIPLGRIDPVAANLFASTLYPAPLRSGLRNNQDNTSRSTISRDQFDAKIDATLSEKDRFSGRYSWSRTERPGFNSFPLFYNSFGHAPTDNVVLDWTRTISPTFVNEARIGVNYVKVTDGGDPKGQGNIGEQFGIKGSNDRGPGLLGLNFSGGIASNIGSGSIGTTELFADTVIQLEDTVILTRGRHTQHMGFQVQRQRINSFYAGNYGRSGNINFDGRWTSGPAGLCTKGDSVSANKTCNPSGFPEADFFLGLPEVVQRGVATGTWGHRTNVISGFFQDNWRFTDALTFNLGIRYETHTPLVEVHDRQANFAPISGEIEFAGKSTFYSNNRALYNYHNWGIGNFQPRIGFAWTPSYLGGKKTVVRGAYTISSYLEGTGTNLRLPLNPPFTTEFNTIYDSLKYPASTIDQGLTILASPTDPFANAVLRLWDPNVQPAVAQQWNLSVERQFLRDTLFTIGYVGQHGTHLMTPMPYFQKRLPGLAGCPSSASAPCPSPYLSGNPKLASISQISGTESNSNMRYDALQSSLQKRFSQGLQYQVAYTYSKCMTNSSGYYGSWGGQTIPTSPYFQNLYDSRAEHGLCYYDATHVLSSYAVYQLPLGRGKKFGGNWNKWVNGVAGNWQLSPILQVRGGFPISLEGDDASGTGSRGARPNCNGSARVFGTRNSPSGGYQWFDPSVYGPAATGTFGTCGVTSVRGPGLRSLDLGLQKEFRFTESRGIEFRTEFINFTNTPVLGAPVPWLGSDLGRVNSSQGARNIQFGLKLFY